LKQLSNSRNKIKWPSPAKLRYVEESFQMYQIVRIFRAAHYGIDISQNEIFA